MNIFQEWGIPRRGDQAIRGDTSHFPTMFQKIEFGISFWQDCSRIQPFVFLYYCMDDINKFICIFSLFTNKLMSSMNLMGQNNKVGLAKMELFKVIIGRCHLSTLSD